MSSLEQKDIVELPSVSDFGNKLAKLLENKEYRDMISSSLLSLVQFAQESEKKTASFSAKTAIKNLYDLVIK